MSSWAKRDTSSTGRGGVASLLDKIPGYSGYRAKESRRDEDKRLREELARQYDGLAQRLSELGGDLARARRYKEIAEVERLERSLRRFVDRLRVATYGYDGLFSDRSIDERALDQIQAFDRALGDGLDELGTAVGALEGVIGGGDLAAPLRQVEGQIDALNRRFDLRGQVIESGQPQEGPEVAALFRASEDAPQPHVADDLHFGDAVSISGADYLVHGRMEFHEQGGDAAWRQFLLRDVGVDSWLHVPPSSDEPLALLQPSSERAGDGERITVAGKEYTRVAAGEATAEIIGEAGRQAGRTVNFRRYVGGGGEILFAYDWGGEHQILAGRTLDPLEIEVFPKA